ncbi:KGGVGR-motif variant AAA ATPase [Streptomyces filamentosus]|uniref:KGGVGR-motif variant AAA ATPase n=1 Tax=Streptomyces filamentosus TaxID=67294 RepID=UPI0012386FAE|nr:ParA family protein [Streptomyces filamentosus]KAA6211255.1 ParA family protein [Streptomyces filamentosus]
MNHSFQPVRFDQARPLAEAVARDAAASGTDVLLVRDILGRFSLLVDDRTRALDASHVESWRQELATSLGRYAADRPLLLASALFQPETLFGSQRACDLLGYHPDPGQGRILLLDNTVVGEGWAKVSTPTPEVGGVRRARTAVYGIKGGVGRSTATFMLAKHLADRGHCVLVADLDLESPGSGPLLLAEEQLPQYGIVDQLVESALSNDEGLDLVAPATHVQVKGNGELWVAPARGRGGPGTEYTYVDKLNRVYVDAPVDGLSDFADRLEVAISACEEAVARESRRPDVVIIDSRAGIHDIAAVALSRLCDLALLFGSDNAQTWAGYRDLFTAWRSSGQAPAIREKLRMVAAMVPDSAEHPKEQYLETFRDHAWSCFSVLYDDLVGDDSTGFNPSPEDASAPHTPIPILFTLDLVGLDAAATPGWDDRSFVRTAYDSFLNITTRLMIEGP